MFTKNNTNYSIQPNIKEFTQPIEYTFLQLNNALISASPFW